MESHGVSTVVGEYRLDGVLGEGGFAVVYRATRLADGAPVAIKLMRDRVRGDAAVAQMFDREATALAGCDHPAVVGLLDAGRLADGTTYLVMELLAGRDLGAELDARGRLGVGEAVELVAALVAAVDALHRRGLVHRDLKAHNVMVRVEDGRLRPTLIDLGLASAAGEDPGNDDEAFAYGTPNSMSAEQLLGGPVDARSDVYALGILLFQVLTGALPFRGRTMLELQEQHLHGRRPCLAAHGVFHPRLDAVIHRALDPDLERRFPDATSLRTAMRAAIRP
jgi:serine/threonine-protein kinase